MSFTIVTDTSSNLPTDLTVKKDLRIIPFSYYIDGKEFNCLDTDAFDGDVYYDKIRGGMKVTTSMITPQSYQEFFEGFLKNGEDLVYVSMSSGISGSCNSAKIAAGWLKESYPDRKIEVVDTLGASLGEGIVALHAAELRDGGATVEEAAEILRAHAKRMFQVFTVDDLMHLRRGGRLSNSSAVIGTLLNIKPLLKGNEEGKIVSYGKVRGRKHSITAMAEEYDALVCRPEEQTVGIAQAGCREDAEMLVSLLKKNRPPKEILTVEYEPVTGSYVGPGALALFFEGDDKVRSRKR